MLRVTSRVMSMVAVKSTVGGRMLGAAEGTAVGTPVGAEDTMPEEYGCLECLLVAPSRSGRTGAAPWQTLEVYPAEGSRVSP